jgi:hypothetical protein
MNATIVFDPTTTIGSVVMELMPKATPVQNGKYQLSGTELFTLEAKAQTAKAQAVKAMAAKVAAAPKEEPNFAPDAKLEALEQILTRIGSLRQPAK